MFLFDGNNVRYCAYLIKKAGEKRAMERKRKREREEGEMEEEGENLKQKQHYHINGQYTQ